MKDRRSRFNKVLKRAAPHAITIGRLFLAKEMTNRLKSGRAIHAPMALFLAADIADGMVARHFGGDNRGRRTIDGLVDKIAVFGVLATAYKQHPEARKTIQAMVAEEALTTTASVANYQRRNEVTKCGGLRKIALLGMSAYVCELSRDNIEADEEASLGTRALGVISVAAGAASTARALVNTVRPLGTVTDNGIRQI